MTIRSAEPTDAEAIARLHAHSWQNAYRGILKDEFLEGPVLQNRLDLWATRLADAQRKGQFILLDEQAGDLRGFACAFIDADPEWGTLLDNLHVAPELKGNGLGRRLICAVAETILEHGAIAALHLWAYEQNEAARRFYERLGGVVTACESEPAPDGTYLNAVRYCWREVAALAAMRQ